MKIYDVKDKQEYIEEIARLTQDEWGDIKQENEGYLERVNNKVNKIKNNLEDKNYMKLVLLDGNTLIGFISMFETDGDERQDLSPWYATMYIKKEYRGKGYSKILNEALLKEAKNRGFKKLYLKSDLINYYQKFGAKYIEKLNNGETLYYIDL